MSEREFMGSIEDELAAVAGETQRVVPTVSTKLDALSGKIVSDKNQFMGADTPNTGALGIGIPSVLPYDDYADLFLDSATGFTDTNGRTTGATSSRNAARRSASPNSGPGRSAIHATYKEPPNIFKHKQDSDAAIRAKYAANGLRDAFVPNILDNYDTITYHWKLFIVDPDSTANGAILNPANQTIIAETGVSDLTIDKVEIGGVVTPSTESGTGTATQIKFEIIEPSGAGMLDKIFYEAISLGIGNWAVMPLYLQLEFRARDQVTSNSLSTEMRDEITSLKWVWPIKISDTKAHVTHVGTRYEFTAIPYSELTQSNVNFVLQHNVKLEDLATFSDAIRELENKLNIDQLVKTTTNYSIPDLYEFHIDPELFAHKISTGNNQDSTRANNMDNLTLKDATFNTGTSIDKVIDNLLSQTELYQKEFLGAKTPGEQGAPATEIPAMKKFWRIVTDARPIRYDPMRQDDAKIFTIYIIRYDIGTADANVFQQANSKNYQEVERKRLMTYVNNKILKKKYNYIFTGLNDQIINLELKLTNAYAVAMARMTGIYTNLAMSDKGVVNQENAKKENEVTAKISSYIALKNNSKYANSAKAKEALEAARRAITTSTLDPETRARMQTLLDQSSAGSRLELRRQIAANHGVNGGSDQSTRFIPQSLAAAAADTNYRFVSDVDLMDPKTQRRYSDFLESTKGRLRPIARVETTQDRQIGIGLESASNSGIQKLSTMYSTALEGFDTGFIKIQMQIKGDPFWLFPAPIASDADRPVYLSLQSPSDAISWIKQAHVKRDTTVNFFPTDNFIVVRFRTPRIYSEDDTTKYPTNDAYDEVNLLSGVYRVIRVISKFESGKFTQELDCVIDNEIDIRNFIKEIDFVMQQPDIPATPADLTNPIPDTNIRHSRIVSQNIAELEGVVSKTAGVVHSATSALNNVNGAAANIGPLLPGGTGAGINSRRIF